jgi:hypothetical protein
MAPAAFFAPGRKRGDGVAAVFADLGQAISADRRQLRGRYCRATLDNEALT